MLRNYSIVTLLLAFRLLSAQQEKEQLLTFKFQLSHLSMPSGSYVHITGSDSARIDACKFYISGLSFLNRGTAVYTEKQSYHLIDMADPRSLQIICKVPGGLRYDALSFYLGIDSITNVSGAMGGDLDPTKGMYWSWQSGYINFKLEGKSSVSAHPKKEFQLHVGGYQQPLSALQPVSLQVNSGSAINILFDVKQFLLLADLSVRHHIMSPGPEAVKLAAMSVHCFSIMP